ncbi:2Fe-2S iron-sulfur cluster-binding protein, partial [Hungatella hathewayi]
MVHITINGKPVEVPENTTIMEAAVPGRNQNSQPLPLERRPRLRLL